MELSFSDKILIFTDGACSGNPGKGGFGTIVATPDGQIQELGESRFKTTNNRMEMMAVIRGLQHIADVKGEVWVLTDSTYVIRGITQWIWGWKKKGWKTASGSEVTNIDLWKELESAVLQRKSLGDISWKYVRGHSGTPGNERCDEIAVEMSHRRAVDLYSGPLLSYSVAIHDLPEDMSLPPMKSKSEKKIAHSYLSYVNGELKRHKTWPECEAQVKGRTGAKFKKALSPSDEIKILSDWGLNASDLEKI